MIIAGCAPGRKQVKDLQAPDQNGWSDSPAKSEFDCNDCRDSKTVEVAQPFDLARSSPHPHTSGYARRWPGARLLAEGSLVHSCRGFARGQSVAGKP